MPEEVTLGGVAVPVIPQKHAYLQHRIAPAIQAAVEGGEGLDPSDLGQWFAAGAYGALCALIPTLPALIPEHAFQGYATAEAYAAKDFNVDAAPPAGCPTLPEIEEAFRVGIRVNGIDTLVELGKKIAGPEGLKVLRAQALSSIASSISSPTSPLPSGESASTTSGTTLPTSTVSEASAGPASEA